MSQILKVSIPLWCDCDWQLCLSCAFVWICFNPTMVRLRPNSAPLNCDAKLVSIPLWCDCDVEQLEINVDIYRFQSHYGAIATKLALTPTCASVRFQSHYGAIATLSFLSHTCSHTCVSIPLWCDCDPAFIRLTPNETRVSIPLWCDCDGDKVAETR